jgi:hypothetical protein
LLPFEQEKPTMGLRKLSIILTSLAALAAVAAFPALPARAQQSAYAIANGGTTLISFQTDNPLGAMAVGTFTLDGAATFLDAIDFRPLTGELFGYLDATDTLYQVDLSTAMLTAVASGSGASATNTNLLGMDFNPTIDRVRVVTESGQNLVYNPNTAAAPSVTTPLFYPAGDPGAAAPLGVRVIESAYTNNISGMFGNTTQYGIDYGTDSLVTIANNAGTLTTIGALGLSIDKSAPFVGFDIFTSMAGVNTAYAIFDTTAGAAPGLYTLDLATGAATSVGAIGGGFTQVYSLAVRPPAAVIPEPGTLALVLPGVVLLAGGVARRRRHRS